MKIALCLSGQARSFKQGFEYYKKNLLDHYDVDVFIHTWKFDGWEEYRDLYNPVEFKIDQSVTADYGKTIDEMYIRTPNKEKFPPRFTYAMLHSMDTCATILSKHVFTTHKNYDWVVRSRSDYALNVKIPFAELDNSKLYIPNCRMVPERDFGNDQFAFSSSKNMDEYSRCFEHIEEFYENGVQYMCEDFMGANWTQYGLIGEKLVYCDVNHPFPPGQYNGTWHSLIREDFEEWLR